MTTQPDEMNLTEVREILADEIRRIRAGDASPANVNAVTNAVGKILSTVKLEMDYYRLLGKTPEIGMMRSKLLPERKAVAQQTEKKGKNGVIDAES